MNRCTIGLLLMANLVPLVAQTKADYALTPTARIYVPKYMSRQRAGAVANLVHTLVPPVLIGWEPLVNGLVLQLPVGWKAGTENPLDKAEELIKRFDVPETPPPPEREIDMTVSLIRASTNSTRSTGEVPVPPDLADVVKEMKGALPYARFVLVDTIHVKVRDQLKIEDALPAEDDAVRMYAPFFYNLEFLGPSVSADGKTVDVHSFRFGVKVPVAGMPTGPVAYQDESINTRLTIPVGQKQVLGKVKFRGGADLFVVLDCKVK